ncbi:MAG: hypothetical protein PUP92_10230 [Rhizonema sp. PD38]|nr:hypothetical protein [Rhizonema sp. PD38]
MVTLQGQFGSFQRHVRRNIGIFELALDGIPDAQGHIRFRSPPTTKWLD